MLLAAVLCVSSTHAQSQLPRAVQLVIDGHALPPSAYGLHVQEIGAAAPLLSVNAEAALNPASTIKTVTTLAALDTLGPAYTWRTELYALGSVADGTLQGICCCGAPVILSWWKSSCAICSRRCAGQGCNASAATWCWTAATLIPR
jgi:D-alanyl-D-alanine carboxypeptidase